MLLLALDASELSVVVTSVRPERLLGEACSDATGGGAEDAGAGADAPGVAAGGCRGNQRSGRCTRAGITGGKAGDAVGRRRQPLCCKQTQHADTEGQQRRDHTDYSLHRILQPLSSCAQLPLQHDRLAQGRRR